MNFVSGSYNIVRIPEDPIGEISRIARICYQSESKGDESDRNLVSRLVFRGHHAMLEFCDVTVIFDNVSRGFTHEMVRHRIASYAQESTRYVDNSDFNCIVPDKDGKFKVDGEEITLADWFRKNESMYRALRESGWRPEDARQVLPIGIKSKIAVKASLREWRHIFTMRCDKHAHWEIREIMLKLLEDFQSRIPIIFDDLVF